MYIQLARPVISAALVLCTASARSVADTKPTDLPITEITTFKDGHAMVVRSGTVGLNEHGDAVLSELPHPILGTFWADELEGEATLASVVSERIEELQTQPASTIPELLQANIGARIAFLDLRDELREGVLREIIRLNSAPGAAFNPASTWNDFRGQSLAAVNTSSIALIETDSGVVTIPIQQIRDLRFLDGSPKTSTEITRQRERMTLDLEWEHAAPDEGDVRLMYVQKGVRWIPSYRVTIIDDDRVRLELQATIVNELADLDDVTMNFAVGVPSFAFASSPDPMSLQGALANLGPHFHAASGTGAMLSNALMSQTSMMRQSADVSGATTPVPASPELTGSERAEDLFVYSVDHITLRRGARMVVPLVSYEVGYESLYRLDIPARPPYEVVRSIPAQRKTAIERALSRPVPTQILRIINDNDGGYPITTAPALILSGGSTLAQGMLTFTAPGGASDLEVGKGVEIAVDVREIEEERELKAVRWNNYDYARARIGFIGELTNRKDKPVRMEIVKVAFGERPEAGQGAQIEMLSPYDPRLGSEDDWNWWHGYSWPWWWSRFNGMARISWDITIEPGQSMEIDANWGYFWR
ncbi:MAG: hypothetical protein CMJ35_16135 [Phycisphaerae bacterium]|nr:hypothetical protein [Phycisphaerae bacterium]